jgi:hypothetical protein
MTEELIKMIVAALAGGGLWQLITWRLRKRKLSNDVAVDQYRDFESIVDSYMQKMTAMSEKIIKIQTENIKLREEIEIQKRQEHERSETTDQNKPAG